MAYPDLAAFLGSLNYDTNVPIYSSIVGTNGKVSGSVYLGVISKKPSAEDRVLPVYDSPPPTTQIVNAIRLDNVVSAYVTMGGTANPNVTGIVLRFRQYSDVMAGDIPPDTP